MLLGSARYILKQKHSNITIWTSAWISPHMYYLVLKKEEEITSVTANNSGHNLTLNNYEKWKMLIIVWKKNDKKKIKNTSQGWQW